MWQGETLPYYYLSQVEFACQVLGWEAPSICFGKVYFFDIFLGPGTKEGWGLALYTFLKRSPGDTDSKYIWICGYIYIGPSVFRCTIFGILTLHMERKKCGLVRITPCYSQSQVVCIKVLGL